MRKQPLIINKLVAFVNAHLFDYPAPLNLSYLWSFGSLSGIALVVQIVTGVLLAMQYIPDVELAFSSVERIIRDVNYGWFLRYLHANGASFMFVVLYIHAARGLYFGGFLPPRQLLWVSGITIFILTIGTGFLGYCLPFGQMSLWGCTVITNLVSSIPLIGNAVVQWLWGGFCVGQPTLNRFFVLHFLLPFIVAALAFVHLFLLHYYGSSNPMGLNKVGFVSFYPFFYVKDLFAFSCYMIMFGLVVFFTPNWLGHSDNYIPGNPLVTPPAIQPEWYFLPFYAILRSIPSKLGGVVAMFSSLLLLGVLPWISNSFIRSSRFKPLYRLLFWFFAVNVLVLGWIGACHIETPFEEIGLFSTIFYFVLLIFLIPMVDRVEASILKIK